jgi:hypothetical protein
MGTNAALVHLLENKQNAFTDYLNSLSEEELHRSIGSKWNALEHAEHIYNSLRLLPPLYATPAFLLRWKFGKANRPSHSYDEVKKRYLEKLASKDVRNNPFAAKKGKLLRKSEVLLRIDRCIHKLKKQLLKMSSKKLDLCILPHPLLGKITLREMLLFSAYHIEHHQLVMQRNAATPKP